LILPFTAPHTAENPEKADESLGFLPVIFSYEKAKVEKVGQRRAQHSRICPKRGISFQLVSVIADAKSTILQIPGLG
jgi:hypothetical protein